MAEIRDELVLDIDEALRAIDRVEQSLGTFNVPVDLDVPDAELRRLQDRLDDVDDVNVDVSIDTDSVREFADRLSDVERSAAQVTDEIDRIERAASDSVVSFRGLADALGTSEREAAALADELIQAERRANDTERSARELADQLGLSEREADAFAASMRRAANNVDDAADLSTRLRSAIGALGGIVAGVGAFQLLRTGVDQAVRSLESYANVGESINAVNVTFGEGADAVLEFGEAASRSAGLAASEFNQLVVPIGALLRNFGSDAQTAAQQSIQLTQRAADLASVFNVDVADALAAIQSGLRGQSEPLTAFGANISAARVQAFALANGLAASTAEITDAVTVQARLGLILADTAQVAGDFANTSDSAANAQRILAAEAENARAAVGEALLPALQAVLDATPALITAIENDLAPAVGQLADSFADAAPALAEFAAVGLRLAGRLPAAFEIVGSVVGGVGDVLGSLTGDVDSLSDISDAFADAFGAGQQAVDDFNVATANLDLVSSLQAGIPPVNAFIGAVSQLAGPTNRFEQSFERLAAIAGITGPTLEQVTREFIAFGDQAGLTADDIEFLEGVLFRLPDSFDDAETARFGRALSAAADEVQRLNAATEPVPTTLQQLAAVAGEAGVEIESLVASTDPLVAALVATLDPAERARLAIRGFESGALDAADAINDELGDALQSLPDIFGQAADGAETSGQEALNNIRTQAAALATFETNVAALFARGQTALANFLLQADPASAATAAADFVANFDIASEAENELRGQSADLAQTVEQLFGDAVDTADLDLAALELTGAFAQGLDSPTARAAIFDALQSAVNRAVLENSFAEIGISVPIRVDATGNIILPTADRLEGAVTGGGGTSGGTTFSGTADRPIVNFNTNINNPEPAATEQSAATLEQQVGTAAALLN